VAGWLIAAADFVLTGGMDIANWRLANFLARSEPVELVSHLVDPALAKQPNIRATIVRRPFNMNLLGEPLLRRKALARSRQILARDGRVVANGGNCPVPDINWVHYVHAAFAPITVGSPLRRAKVRHYHRRCVSTERQAFEQAKVIICNSKISAKHVVERCGIPAKKTRVVYYGSDPDMLKQITDEDRRAARELLKWDDRPWAVFIGALGDRRKGFDVLYEAWRRLCADANWDANLAVIGRGAELESWKRRTNDDALSERINFLGFRDDVPRVLAACDVMVHPARYEAYGLGVHEAVARGLPAIVSAQAGVAERLAGLEALLLLNPEDANALVDRLRHWCANLESYRERTAPLAAAIRRHSWDDMARDFVAAAN
jgi:glycosyltransferase involved in cell wall biosynthesis